MAKKILLESPKDSFYLTKTAFNSPLKDAVRRGMEFHIQPEDILKVWREQNGKCAYSGLKLTSSLNYKENDWSIDRIDNNKPYLKDNFVLCYKPYNMFRGTMSVREFIIACILVTRNHQDKIEQTLSIGNDEVKKLLRNSTMRISKGITAGDRQKDRSTIRSIRNELKQTGE